MRLSLKRSEMKGIILAGGGGSRLYPVTKVVNKHLIPVGDKPMIIHAVEKLVEAGLPEILIVGSGDSLGDIVKLLGSGKEFFCKLSYRVQDEPNGIAKRWRRQKILPTMSRLSFC